MTDRTRREIGPLPLPVPTPQPLAKAKAKGEAIERAQTTINAPRSHKALLLLTPAKTKAKGEKRENPHTDQQPTILQR